MTAKAANCRYLTRHVVSLNTHTHTSIVEWNGFMRSYALVIIIVTTLVGCNLYSELERPAADSQTVDSGTDSATPTDVGGGCQPISNDDFCGVNGADCGEITNFDNCGDTRTVDCGTCTNGATCGDQQPNVCGCPCDIGGTCVAEGSINPDNPCEICDPATDEAGWSARTGEACDTDNACNDSVCSDTGVCEVVSVVDCSDVEGECLSSASCDPADGICKGDAAPDNTPCALDGVTCTADVCLGGRCEHPARDGFCFVDGECLSAGDSPTNNSCVVCDGTGLVNEPRGSRCGSFGTCASGMCDGMGTCALDVDSDSCAIDGDCHNDGDDNPNNRCEICDPSTSQTEWTPLPMGTRCRFNCSCRVGGPDNELTCLRSDDSDCN
jgi:hypothetical protein